MKKLIFCLLIAFPCCAFAQFGLKAGANFANVSNASSINSSSRSGFMIGAFFAPKSKRIISYGTEIVYSRQGYDFKTSTKTGNVNLDYILIPQLMGINITKYVQLQLGAQMAFLINAKADSTTSSGSTGAYGQVMSYYNKFDYGICRRSGNTSFQRTVDRRKIQCQPGEIVFRYPIRAAAFFLK